MELNFIKLLRIDLILKLNVLNLGETFQQPNFVCRACLDERRKGEFNGASKRYRDRDLRAIDEWRRRSIHRRENRCALAGPLLSRPDIRKLLHHSAPHAFILLFPLCIVRGKGTHTYSRP